MSNWNPERHEPLTNAEWDRAAVTSTIRDIAHDAIDTHLQHGRWPTHPRDKEDGGTDSASQYMGAAGVVTGLRVMRSHVERDDLDLTRALLDALDRAPDVEEHPSLLIGRTGALLALESVTSEPSTVRDQLAKSIEENFGSDADELMWGLAGTLLAALHLYRESSEERFAELARSQAKELFERWDFDAELGYHIWEQNLYGRRRKTIGAAHGAMGNVHALWTAHHAFPDLLDEADLLERTRQLAEATAIDSEDGTNWPPVAGMTETELVQWCHGAPGVVPSLCAVPPDLDDTISDLVARGAELIWNAGPLTKGHNLCHGTAGNAYALLFAYDHTGDEIWLERSRHFAMHAIEQYRRIRDEWGRGWFSLWTGDIGLGVFLVSLLDKIDRPDGPVEWWGWERF